MTGQKIAIDIGSTNITVFAEGKGIIICEPACMCIDTYNGKTIARGIEALKMKDRLPSSMKMIYPVKNGLINDYDRTVRILRGYLNRICRGRILRPNVLLCVPGTVTELERKTIFDAVIEAGAGRACFVDQPLASAVGAGIPLTQAEGVMICDIGAYTADCAVISGGNIVISDSLHTGGKIINQVICSHLMENRQLATGDDTAEALKKVIGSAVRKPEEIEICVSGKSVLSFLPHHTEVTSTEILEAITPEVSKITNSIHSILETISPELCADIIDNGILLTGEASNLEGLDTLITRETGIKTFVAESPDICAALGMGKLLREIDFLEKHGYIFKDNEKENVSDD